jgi:hypothetical protein
MTVLVFRDARFAARCAREIIVADERIPVASEPGASMPYKVITATTIETGMHKRGAPGAVAGTDGVYDTALARGGVLALGVAYNRHDALIVQADLARLAGEIAG